MPPTAGEWVQVLRGYQRQPFRESRLAGIALVFLTQAADALAEESGVRDEAAKLRWVCLRMQELLEEADAEVLRLRQHEVSRYEFTVAPREL
jgi:hypothetical protein